MKRGDNMKILEEAIELIRMAGCEKAFAVYQLKLNNIATVKDCNKNGESLEIEKNVSELVSTIDCKLELDPRKPIECPLNSSMNKYLEIHLQNRSINLCNLSEEEYFTIKNKIRPLLDKYNWNM